MEVEDKQQPNGAPGAQPPAGGAAAPPPAAPASAAPPAGQPAEGEGLLKGTPPAGDKTKAPPGDPKAPENKPGDEPKALELKVPEGFTPDAPLLKEFSALAGKHGLKAEQAQAILELYTGDLKRELAADAVERKAQNDAWVTAIKKDPEVGGEKFDASMRLANIAIDQLGGKELVEVLAGANLQSHPVLFKALAKVGGLLSEDRIQGTANGTPHKKRPETYEEIGAVLFPGVK